VTAKNGGSSHIALGKNFKLETIGPQWFSSLSLMLAELKCRCGPGFFAPQNEDQSRAIAAAAAQ
jgi:hypothetical protein